MTFIEHSITWGSLVVLLVILGFLVWLRFAGSPEYHERNQRERERRLQEAIKYALFDEAAKRNCLVSELPPEVRKAVIHREREHMAHIVPYNE